MAFTITVKMAALLQRCSTGDIDAFQEVWPLIMDRPLDPDESLEKAAKELADRIESLVPKAEPKKVDPNEAIAAAAEALTEITLGMIQDAKKKRAGRA
jgi:DNA-directed RNA polymerase subunit L